MVLGRQLGAAVGEAVSRRRPVGESVGQAWNGRVLPAREASSLAEQLDKIKALSSVRDANDANVALTRC